MRRTPLLALVLVVVLSGCTGSDAPSSADDASSPNVPLGPDASDPTYFFEISEVGLGRDGYVALTNFTDAAASLDGLYLCQPPRCIALPDVEVDPQGRAVIAMTTGSGLDDVVASDAPFRLERADGELVLSSTDGVKGSDSIRSYLQWGSSPHDVTRLAVEAGLWLEGAFAPSSEEATRLYRTEQGLWLFDTA